jgi:hypothetical protein
MNLVASFDDVSPFDSEEYSYAFFFPSSVADLLEIMLYEFSTKLGTVARNVYICASRVE